MVKPKNVPPTPDALNLSLDEFFRAINHQNHLACVLVTTSYLELCLSSLLRRYFVETSSTADEIFDYKTNGVLTDISARSKMAYCLGLISSEIFTNLNEIGNIRNRFAHTHPELTFADADVQGICAKLKLPAMTGLQVTAPTTDPATPSTGATKATEISPAEFEEKYSDPKDRFAFIATTTAMRILMSAHAVKRCDHQKNAVR